jgi:hypothetical protein
VRLNAASPISLVSFCSLCIYVNRNIFCPHPRCGSERVPKRMSKKGNLFSPVLPWSSHQRNWPLETLCVCVSLPPAYNMPRLFTFASYISTSVCVFAIHLSRVVLVHASHAYQVHLHQSARTKLTGHAATICSQRWHSAFYWSGSPHAMIDAHEKKCNGLSGSDKSFFELTEE